MTTNMRLGAPRDNLVLLHGWGMNDAVWTELPAPLTRRLAPLPVALPGHGSATGALPRPDVFAWARDCLERAPEDAVWLGWSLGGLVALAAALQAPKRVRALILMTSTPRFVQAVDWRVAMPAETLAQFAAALSQDPAGVLERFLALQVRGSSDERGVLRRLRSALAAQPAAQAAALADGLALLQDEDLRGPLPDVRPPSLWLFGERDTLVPAALAERIPLLMPGARTRVIAGAGHAPFLSHPSAVSEEIDAFLDSIGS
jgi:pimeloyl-[acyl-carrier protein] methyl ester esterase